MSVEVDGLEESIEIVEAAEDRLDDLTPAMAVIAERLRAFIHERFATRTAPDGTPWPPLKAHTIATRKPNGKLEASVYAIVTPNGVRFGASADYAEYQNAARPFIPTTLADGTLAGESVEPDELIASYVTDGVPQSR